MFCLDKYLQALDLAYATSDACGADKEALRRQFGSEEEEEEEEEENDESSGEDSEVAGVASTGLLAFLQLLSGGGTVHQVS